MGKVKDIAPAKVEAITAAELEKLQTMVTTMNQTQTTIGGYEAQKHEMIHQLAGYKNELAEYQKEVYGGHTIVNILEEETKYSVYIQKGDMLMPWKDFNKHMAISIEYDLKW